MTKNSLYKSTSTARKITIAFGIFTSFTILLGIYNSIIPEPQTPQIREELRFYMRADRVFGDIQKPTIPGIPFNQDASFALQSAHTQAFPDVSYVYAVEEPRQKLLSLENAREVVQTLGFPLSSETEDVRDTPNVYSWTMDSSTKRVTYDANEQMWELNTDYFQNVNAQAPKEISDNLDDYSNTTLRLIRALNFNTLGLESPEIEIIVSELNRDGTFSRVNSVQDENDTYIHLNAYRILQLANLKPTSERPNIQGAEEPDPVLGKVYSDDPRYGQFYAVVSNDGRNFDTDVFELDFIDFEYSEQNRGAYLIITPNEAWSNVQRGDGSLVQLTPQGQDFFDFTAEANVVEFEADARDTELAFYEPKNWSGFVTPIYVFSGTATLEDGRLASFTIFVDAIKRLT